MERVKSREGKKATYILPQSAEVAAQLILWRFSNINIEVIQRSKEQYKNAKGKKREVPENHIRVRIFNPSRTKSKRLRFIRDLETTMAVLGRLQDN